MLTRDIGQRIDAALARADRQIAQSPALAPARAAPQAGPPSGVVTH